MKFTHDHRLLFGAVFALFLVLTIAVAIMPALQNQANYDPLPNSKELTADEKAGKDSYIANGCVACHTQQVRNVDMDKSWGSRPSIAADYARSKRTSLLVNTATLMGTARTGPDLTSIGSRQPSEAWQLMHLYNPRSVVPDSIMAPYPWLFEEKAEAGPDDVVVSISDDFKKGPGVIVAKKEALQLVAYLLSLKQTPLPDGTPDPEFLYPRAEIAVNQDASADGTPGAASTGPKLDGEALYAANCQACHQANGEGLKGAFPSLKDSPIVIDDNPENLLKVIMKGYDARAAEGFPPMPAIGVTNNLNPAEIHAIIDHERSSWGNKARFVPLEEVEEILKKISQ
jgi:cytochrome c oxidase cbb3-type subunit 2